MLQYLVSSLSSFHLYIYGSFVTTIYRKPTFSGIYTNFTSFMPRKYKYGLILTLLFRSFTFLSFIMKLTN